MEEVGNFRLRAGHSGIEKKKKKSMRFFLVGEEGGFSCFFSWFKANERGLGFQWSVRVGRREKKHFF